MKILIISDLHANAEALGALSEAYDELWVLGDLVDYGPDPRSVVQAVRELATLVVRGNHDHAVGYGVDPQCAPAFRAMAAATQRYAMEVLAEDHKAYLRELPLTQSVVRDGRRVYLCHATPSDPLFAYCPPDSPDWSREAEMVDADVILVGHTHLPFMKRIGSRRVVNPGSLGQPKHGGPQASYAIWRDGEISLRTVPYPFERTIDKLKQLPLEPSVLDELVQLLKTGNPSAAPVTR
jgi:protein phosphatase